MGPVRSELSLRSERPLLRRSLPLKRRLLLRRRRLLPRRRLRPRRRRLLPRRRRLLPRRSKFFDGENLYIFVCKKFIEKIDQTIKNFFMLSILILNQKTALFRATQFYLFFDLL